ncbi:ankyrin repeat domain-containing protein 34B [Poecilia reticulata]|uniref:Ankyrin repeat domain 34Ba n=1 Tax=Poecilia reticulata TaxID=8081 RepID=A0A3P9PQK8_POERE|nr:PREDICTED: ankyrin repeat domain-containing protein 34B-like [Poecilia reticulata]XP_008421514.1 PREDICTED: ankyrin repeat domain-containing protein 34B-like [Poecilia reticulata]
MEAKVCNLSIAVDSGNPLLKAVFLRRLRLTRLLLEGGAYINESDSQGQTPLMVACRTKHTDSQCASRVKMIQFLLERGADPNIQDKKGRSALMHTCRDQAGPEVVSLLLASGADISLEDRSGISALVYAVVAGDWNVLKLLLDACKAKGKEVIIITTDKFPNRNLAAKQYLSMPVADPVDETDPITAAAPVSPSEIQLITSPQCTSSSLCPPKQVFSFKEGQICGASSHPCSPSRFRGLGQATPGGLQQPLQRLNSEPWLKISTSLLAEPRQSTFNLTKDISFTVPNLERDSSNSPKGFRHYGRLTKDRRIEDGKIDCSEHEGDVISLSGLLSSHSASHPNLHSETRGTDPAAGSSALCSGSNLGATFHGLASSSLNRVIQTHKLSADIYGSDPQLAVDLQSLSEEQRDKAPLDGKKLAPLRCSTTMGSRDSLKGYSKRGFSLYERRGSGTFLLDHNHQARPRSLPPLTKNPNVNVAINGLGNGSGFSEKELGQKGFLPCAPPGQPKELTRRMLLRRHSMQTEQFKSSV